MALTVCVCVTDTEGHTTHLMGKMLAARASRQKRMAKKMKRGSQLWTER